ncbi:MAG: exonuclease SbcCD subunit D C-terminal domain-containing protein, partial [Helcococcus sp.]|nr:exonuclease SbcCD subunit D C-terminal domain-containing protein [Helcococcus sp.]
YQNTVPSVEAIKVFEKFLSRLNSLDITTLIISGNHDSSDRLSYANEFFRNSEIYISNSYNGEIEKVSFNDEFGKINFYLFPYIKPANVKRYFEDREIISYQDAVKAVIESIELDKSERNVMISHQFILNAEISESEEIYAGEAEAVSMNLYKDFDYVALGHIHKKQSFLNGKIRYPGALLKYASSESNYDKSITIVDIKEKNNIEITERKIEYLHEMRKIRGFFDDIILSASQDSNPNDYIHIELLDDIEISEGLQRLREFYPNIMTMRYDKLKIENNNFENFDFEENEKSPLELFNDFYYLIMGQEISSSKEEIIKEAIDKIWRENENN